MAEPSDDQQDSPAEGRGRELHPIESPADDPQTRPALDLEVGLAERVTTEDS